MAIPMIAAGIAARAIAKKLATRATGGITGSGAKSVGSVYKEQGFSNSVLSRPAYTPVNSFGTGSVKKVPSVSLSQNRAKVTNEYKTDIAQKRKSGEQSKSISDSAESFYKTYTKSPTVKINSNMRAR
jgi:hypothetical protein